MRPSYPLHTCPTPDSSWIATIQWRLAQVGPVTIVAHVAIETREGRRYKGIVGYPTLLEWLNAPSVGVFFNVLRKRGVNFTPLALGDLEAL
jgi:hypothetical protein